MTVYTYVHTMGDHVLPAASALLRSKGDEIHRGVGVDWKMEMG